ncbi:MAG TPA: hypothetical protein VGN08_06625 [Solirubrobacteraceae bacterium]|jgi:hypothetical protein
MGQLQARTLEDLEGELQERAFARDAELLTGTGHDGRFRAAFVQFGDRIARRGVVLLEAVAGDMHVALECLLAADAERASARRYRSTAP